MATVKLGARRLYDALGIDTTKTGEIHHAVEFAIGDHVTIYLGPKPPLGVLSLEADQYGIPGRKSKVLHTNLEYDAPCFLEITVANQREISEEQFLLLQNKDKKSREGLLEEARNREKYCEQILDVLSGVLGLRVHRQLVLRPLVENAFLSGEFEPVSSFAGPAVEMLEGITTNSNTSINIENLLKGMKSTSEDMLRKGGAILHWLLKAWRERDSISRFMYLFIPLEAILKTAESGAIETNEELTALEALVAASEVSNKEQLLAFLERARTRLGPTLNSRFEEFARQAAIPGWEVDVQAFKKYNYMRNLLLHAGNRNVLNHINLEENTRTLEDLVERYLSHALLGNAEVYASRWRPKREVTGRRDR